ncbi:MAG: allophanate hydrolase subunit 1 [Nocardioidaceae bacterium]|nr:allophanate hydrolase subunit 1 [Nocardioidaceae bacterium]
MTVADAPDPPLKVVDYGDSGILVTVNAPDRETRWSVAHRLAAAVVRANPPWLTDLVASYDSVFLEFDPVVASHAEVRATLRGELAAAAPAHRARAFTIPVVYGGEHGPDLDEVAAELSLSPEQVVSRHAGTPWVIRFLGAPAASPMMDRSDVTASVRRRKEPRTAVPAGSLGVSGQQSIIYPVTSPGGWRLIGRTPVQLLDIVREPLVPYRPGDTFTLVPIRPADWDRWSGCLHDLADRLAEELQPRA